MKYFVNLIFNFCYMKKLFFTDRSLTEPGLAYSGAELIRRTLNGTMPPIYHDHQPYDFEEPDDDHPNDPHRSYLDQETSTDFNPLPVYPNLDDVLNSRNLIEKVKVAAVNVARHLKKSQSTDSQPVAAYADSEAKAKTVGAE